MMSLLSRFTRALLLLPAVLCVTASLSWLAGTAPASSTPEFVGSGRCAACHGAIADAQFKSDHALTVRPLQDVPQFIQALPLRYVDSANSVQYQFQRSGEHVVLVAARGQETAEIELLWAFGAGRQGLTFIGKTKERRYSQLRVSWYASSNDLDITPGSKAVVKDATDALADWFEPGKREECFACHVSQQADLLPEEISPGSVGIQCERCHGPGSRHVQAVTDGKAEQGLAIRNPGRMQDREQYRFCGECHRQRPADFDSEAIDKVIKDKVSIRYPARRLILSRCYTEGSGGLKCTLCHNPHQQLAVAPADYDSKCLSCHAPPTSGKSACPVGQGDCVTCHMPRESLTRHLEFADHWIRVVRAARPKN